MSMGISTEFTFPMGHYTMKYAAFAILFTLAAGNLRADTVAIKGGSMLTGTIVAVDDTTVQIDTSFAGVITVKRDQIIDLSISELRYYTLQSGSTLLGRVRKSGGRTVITTDNGQLDITEDVITGSWGKDEESLQVQALKAKMSGLDRTWKYDIAADLAGKTGNTDRLSTGGTISATLKGPNDKLNFYAGGNRARENDVLSNKEAYGGIDYEQTFAGKNSWYTRARLEYDAIELLDLRTTVAVGWGYYFFNNPEREFRGRLGLQFQHEAFTTGRSESSPGLDAGVFHRIELGKTTLTSEITITPAFEDFGRYQFNHETSWNIPLSEENWSLRLGARNDYNSMPTPSTERLDTSYFAKLALSL